MGKKTKKNTILAGGPVLFYHPVHPNS